MNTDKEKEKIHKKVPAYDKFEKNVSEIIEDHIFAPILAQLNKDYASAKTTAELTDEDIEAMKEAKAESLRQQKREWLRNSLKEISKRSVLNSELWSETKECLKLLDRIESGETRLWGQLDTIIFTIIQCCRAEDEKQRESSKIQAEIEAQKSGFGFGRKSQSES